MTGTVTAFGTTADLSPLSTVVPDDLTITNTCPGTFLSSDAGIWFDIAANQTITPNSLGVGLIPLLTVPLTCMVAGFLYYEVWLQSGGYICGLQGISMNSGLSSIATPSGSVSMHNPSAFSWSSSASYAVGTTVYGVNGGVTRIYKCTTAGTSGASAPTWPTSGTVTDGTVVWTESAIGTPTLNSADPIAAAFSINYGTTWTLELNTQSPQNSLTTPFVVTGGRICLMGMMYSNP